MAAPRPTTPLARIPRVVLARCPERGMSAAGGGLTSSPWRVAMDLDGHLSAGAGTQRGGASFGPLPVEWVTVVGLTDRQALVALADRAWRELRQPVLQPTAHYDEVILLRDGAEAFFLQGFGPIQGGAAGDLIARLRALANAARP